MIEIKFNTCEELACGKCADIVIELKDPTVLNPACKYIKAEILDVVCVASNNWEYTIQYDDSLLADPTRPLRECDLERTCCLDACANYLEERLAKVTAALPDLSYDPAQSGFEIDVDNQTATWTITLINNTDGTTVSTQTVDLSAFFDDMIVTYVLQDNGDGTITLVGSDGNNTDLNICAIIQSCISSDAGNVIVNGTDGGLFVAGSTLVDNGDGTYTHTSATGEAVTIDVCAAIDAGGCRPSLVANEDGSFTFNNGAGEITNIPKNSISSLVDNNNGSFTHIDGENNPITFDVCNALTQGNCRPSLISNPDGSFIFNNGIGQLTVIPAPPEGAISTLERTGSTGFGTNILTHTDGNGGTQTFCEGFESKSLNFPVACPEVGVGGESIITQADITASGKTLNLTLSGRERIFGQCFGGANVDPGVGDITAPGLYTKPQTVEVVFNNPSQCNSAIFNWFLDVGYSGTLASGFYYRTIIDLRYDGGQWVTISNNQSANTGVLPLFGTFGLGYFGEECIGLAPGQTQTLELRVSVQTEISGNGSSEWIGSVLAIRGVVHGHHY